MLGGDDTCKGTTLGFKSSLSFFFDLQATVEDLSG